MNPSVYDWTPDKPVCSICGRELHGFLPTEEGMKLAHLPGNEHWLEKDIKWGVVRRKKK